MPISMTTPMIPMTSSGMWKIASGFSNNQVAMSAKTPIEMVSAIKRRHGSHRF